MAGAFFVRVDVRFGSDMIRRMAAVIESGETALWRAVVCQALSDAGCDIPGAAAARPDKREYAQAYCFIFAQGHDRHFRRVCEWADLDPDVIRAHAAATLDKAERRAQGRQRHRVTA